MAAQADTLSSFTQNARRSRVREVLPKLFLGFHATGPKNSLTDVPGVLVSTQSIHKGAGHNPDRPESIIHTGVTTILPRRQWFDYACHAATFTFNGSGELTGTHWINETGLLNSPVVLTNSLNVGAAYDGVYRYAIKNHAHPKTGLIDWFLLPVVGETFDGYLNDVAAMAVTPEMVVRGIETATDAPVPEGNTGGGTGMCTMGFKAGTGSASRVVSALVHGTRTQFTIGCLVQSNFGAARDLRYGPVPVGRLFEEEDQKANPNAPQPSGGADNIGQPKEGSIIIVLATDAPLHPIQLQRLVKRATVGVARTGGWGSNSSGDIFIAFSTAHMVAREPERPANLTQREARMVAQVSQDIAVVNDTTINGLFEAAADTVEESILNALCMAETTDGPMGARATGIDLERLKRVAEQYQAGR